MTRARRIALFSALGLLALVAVVVAAGVFVLRSDAGRAWIAAQLEAAVSEPGGLSLGIGALEGALPAELRLREVTLADPDGVWLTLDRAEAAWSPLALLSGRLDVDSLTVGTLGIARAPVTPGSPDDDTAAGLPELPLEIALRRLTVERLELGEALLGAPAVLGVTGTADADGSGGLATKLDILRLDGVAGRVTLDAGLAAERLRLDLTASEPPGGVMARLLALPDLPAVEIGLQGDGPLTDWRGELRGSLEALAEWQAALALAVDDAEQRLTLDGSARLGLDPASPLGALLAGEQRFGLSGVLSDGEALTIERLTLDNATLALSAGGSLALSSLESDLTAEIAVKDPAALPDWPAELAVEGLELDAAAQGPLLQPEAQADVTVASATLPGTRLDGLRLTVAATPRDPLTDPAAQLDLSGDLALAGYAVEALEALDGLVGPGLRGSFAGSLDLGAQSLALTALGLDSGQASLAGSGTLDLAVPAASLDLDLALADLAPLEPLLGLPLGGRAILALALVDARLDQPLVAPFTLLGEDLTTGIAQADVILGPEPEIAGRVHLATDGGLRVEALNLTGATLTATAEAELDAAFETLEARYGVAVPDLAALSAVAGTALAGSLEAEGTARGALAAPALALEARAEGLRAAGLDLGRTTLSLTARDLATGPAGELSVEVPSPTGPLMLDSGYRLEGDALALEGLSLRAAGSEAEGTLTLDLASGLAEGTLQGRSADLAPWLGLAGLDGGGRAAFGATLRPRAGKQAAALTAELADVTLSSGGAPPLTLESLTLEGRSADITTLAGEVSARASGLAIDELALEELTLSGRGDAGALGWSLAARGAYREPLSLAASGQLALRDAGVAATVESLEGGALGLPFALRAPLSLEQSPAGGRLAGLDLELAGGRLAGDAALDGRSLDARLSLDDLPLAALRGLAELPELDGRIGATLAVTGAAPTPEGRLTLALSDLETRAVADAPPLQVAVEGDWRDGRLALDGTATGFAEQPARLSLALPLRLDPESLAPLLPGDGPLAGTLDWSGPIDQVWPLVPVGDQLLSGQAELAARVAGTLDAPQASGSLAIAGGRYENLTSGTLLTDLELRLALDGRRAVIERLEASDGGPGRLTASGAAELLPERGFPFELAAALDRLTVLRRDEVTAALDGRVTLSGTAEATEVVGRLETRRVEIGIPDQLPPEVVELEVEELNRPGGPAQSAQESDVAAAGPGSVALDVTLAMPGQVFVRGRGLDSEWRGDLAVGGTAQAPEIAGELTLVRGQLAVLGRDFALTRGRISFPGGAELDPLLDVEAENEGDDVTVVVSLFGAASRPEIAFSSRPPLPRDEILARVLFDKNTTQLTPFEALQLASAAAELSGQGSGTSGVLDFARDLIGVDVLRFESGSGESDLPGLAAGKYVTDEVFLGVKQGATAGSGEVGVEVELTPNLSVDSGVDQRGSSKLGVKFKWDY